MLCRQVLQAGRSLGPARMSPLMPLSSFARLGQVGRVAQLSRSIGTERISGEQEQAILVEQRKNRPMSPHLEIYQPQLTWYLSGLHRITGVALAFGFYGGLVAYAGLPLVGLPFSVADVAAWWGSSPGALKIATKALIAFPLSFHSWNGIRHLIWDTGRELTLKGVYRTGYAVLGLSAITAVGLALL